MTHPCRTCSLPTDHPDGQHPACAEHERGQVVARPCARCGSWSSHPVLDDAPTLCSFCRAADAQRDADAARAELPPPPPVEPRPGPPVYRVGTGPGTRASDKIADWAKS